MKRMYQYIKIPGKDLSYEGHDRDRSKFWSEGKWNSFIDPLLPSDSLGLPFLEIGANSGLYLKMAEDKGFRRVIGIEPHPDFALAAEWYKESTRSKFEILKQSMDASFDWTQIPRLGMTLIANTHYYMKVNDFAETINSLRNRSLYCLIVSVNGITKRSGNAGPDISEVRGFFRDWTEVGVIENISTEGDPSLREGMYSTLFKSNLTALDVEETWQILVRRLSRDHRLQRNGLLAPMEDFYKRLAAGEEFDIRTTPMYNLFSITKSPDEAYKHLVNKKILFGDIKKDGIKDLIYFSRKIGKRRHISDGLSRLAIARSLGYKKVIAKIL